MNGNRSHADLVDRVLEGKDSDTKARVLDLIYRLRLEPTDELFLFCIAIGYLETIVTDAPDQWEQVFTNFRKNLEQWKNNHIKTLETSGELTAQIAKMTQNLTAQTEYMRSLTEGLKIMARRLENTIEQSPDAAMTSRLLKRLFEEMEEQSRTTKREMRSVSEAISTLEHHLKRLQLEQNTSNGYKIHGATSPLKPPTTSDPTTTKGIKALLLLLLLLNGGIAWMQWRQQQVSSWLLYKANRIECQQGIVSLTSPQCTNIK